MKKGFRVRICSDLDFEYVVADICYQNNTVAIISQENGIDNLEIRILPPPENSNFWDLSLEDLLDTMFLAKEILKKGEANR